MKIAIFEIESWEKRYLSRKLKGHELLFSPAVLDGQSAAQFSDADIISVFIYSKVNRDTLAKLKSLKLISTRSTGFDHIDIQECRRRGVAVCNVPNYGENTVAELTFALILSLSRRLHRAQRRQLAGDYTSAGLTGFDLMGKTLGVVGTGRIGLHVIRIARGFGMKVLAFDVRPNEPLAEVLGFTYTSLEVLLAQSHVVTLHVPLNDQTYHLMDKQRLGLMRRGAYLVNTARGGVVDTPALLAALDGGRLAGAGLDVLEGEELIKEDRAVLCKNYKCPATLEMNEALISDPKVIVTPHIAFNSREALHRILDSTASGIEAFLAGKGCHAVESPTLT